MSSNKDTHLASGYMYIKEMKTSFPYNKHSPYYIHKIFVKYP